MGLGYFAASFADGFWMFAILITVAGAGDATWHPLATGILAQVHRDRRAYALGVHAIGGHMAEVLGLIITGYILSLTDWRTATQIVALPALAMGLAFAFLVGRVPRTEASRPTRTDFADVWRSWATPAGVRVVALFTFYNMALFAIVTMTPVFLQSTHNFDWQATALILATMMVLGVLGQPGMGWLSDQVGRRPLLVSGNAIAAVTAVAAWMLPVLWMKLVALGIAITVLVAIPFGSVGRGRRSY